MLSALRSAIMSWQFKKTISSASERVKLGRALQKHGNEAVDSCFRFLAQLEDEGYVHWSQVLDLIDQVMFNR